MKFSCEIPAQAILPLMLLPCGHEALEFLVSGGFVARATPGGGGPIGIHIESGGETTVFGTRFERWNEGFRVEGKNNILVGLAFDKGRSSARKGVLPTRIRPARGVSEP
ncbi:MAG: hypothetical protein ACE5MK_06010 [Acidobacteriota bacterium]